MATAAKLKKKKANPSEPTGAATDREVAAKVAGEFIRVFDVDQDGELDKKDVRLLKSFPAPAGHADKFGEPAYVVDLDTMEIGTIAGETNKGDAVVSWADGEFTIEKNQDFATENGVKSWYLRQRAGRHFKRGLKLEEKLRRAKQKQASYERKYRQNPGLLAAFAELAVGIDSAMSVHSRLKKIKPATPGKKVKKNSAKPFSVQNCRKFLLDEERKNEKRPPIPITYHGRRNPAKMKKGDRVKFRKPANADERKAVMQIVEMRGDRALVTDLRFKNWAVPPTSVYAVADLKPVTGPGKKSKARKRQNLGPSAKVTSHVPGIAALYANYKAFQGRNHSKVFDAIKPKSAPDKLWALGKLLEIKIKGRAETLDFRREKTNRTFWLTSDAKNVQLWIAGAKYASADHSFDIDDVEVIGEIVDIVYETEKAHLGDEQGKASPYIHFLGDRGGERPFLAIDRDGMAVIIGGGYEITPLGIDD